MALCSSAPPGVSHSQPGNGRQEEGMTGWLFRRVGVDVHMRDRYVAVGRVPVIVLVLFALSVVVGAAWLVFITVRSLAG